MQVNVNITWGQVMVAMALLVIGLLVGYGIPRMSEMPELQNLSEKDLNTIAGINYYGGFCERLGLESNVYVQQDQNGKVYGLPICVPSDVK